MSLKAENMSNSSSKEPTKMAKPSVALLIAKQEATQLKMASGKKNSVNAVKDIYQKVTDAKDMIRKDTGIIYDNSMENHKCLWDNNYPECPERLTEILKRCKQLGLIKRCKYIPTRYAEYTELLLKHTPAHIELLKSTQECEDINKLEVLASKYDAIYFHPTTYQLSLLAVGSTINLIENICTGNIQNGMAIIRPPGHHAMKTEYCGYCFFNNVAIAAEVVLRNNLSKKILIVDWDVHHGQATQKMFYNDPRVVYFSIHRYEYGEFWPNLKESDYHYIGEKSGEGFNFNIPLNKSGMTNADYIAIFQQILLPMAYEFQPDLIIVSAGYDAALGCPEGLMNLTPACYSHLLSSLLCLASGRVAVILEGGYCLKSLAESTALTLKTLLGDPCPIIQNLIPPCTSVQETILNVIYAHKPYWKCFQYQNSYSVHNFTHDSVEEKHVPTVIFKGPVTFPTVFETRNCYPIYSEKELQKINMELDSLIQNTNLNMSLNKVCLIYDERMLKHCNPVDVFHPEKPSRISNIFDKHKDFNLLKRCFFLEGRIAKEEEILLAHTQNYIDDIKKTTQSDLHMLVEQSANLNSVYLHPETWNNARISVGSLLQAVDTVLNGVSQSGIAIVRPPGHHAGNKTACGFCIFNNVTIAARYAVSFYNLKRVLIVDWDVHHGNGTQSILKDDPTILYISIHRYDDGSFFPQSNLADYTFVGENKGEGYNVNIPWNKKGMGDAEYVAAFQQIVMPIAYQYNPDLILVSAGFDACIADPLGGCKVSPELYGHMTHWLSSLANGRVILTLEGGYNVNSIANAMVMCTKALLGDPLVLLEGNQVACTSAVTTIKNVIQTHKKYWPNLVFYKSLPQENILPKVKISRDKPTTRLNPHNFPNLSSNDKFAEKQEQDEIPQLQQCVEQIQLEVDLQNLKFKETANSNNDKTNYSNKSNSASTSNNDIVQPSSSSNSQNSSETTLVNYLQDNLQLLVNEEMFAVIPLSKCPHLDSVSDVPPTGIDINTRCVECATTDENWVCLKCYTVHCARNINQHAILHEQATQHPLTLSFTDLSVWCYKCEAYIDNPQLYAARNAVHQSKFNVELPWTYFNEVESSSPIN